MTSCSRLAAAGIAVVAALTVPGADAVHAHDRGRRAVDFGAVVEGLLERGAHELFGIVRPLAESAPPTEGAYRSPSQPAHEQVALARGLRVEYLARSAANLTDMMAFFPEHAPTHLVTCVEGGRQVIDPATGKLNPSVQRIHLKTGAVATVLRGLSRCDGIRTTPWGTVLVTEEQGDGGAYEILRPLHTTEEVVLDRASGQVSAPDRIAKRSALPTMAWEGLAVLPSGVVIGGDELRPGSGTPDTDGGAVFKFVPAVPRTAEGPIGSLTESPLAAGSVYAMRISCTAGIQYGQGCEIGNASWVPVTAAGARADADAVGATGYYRPEDLHEDPDFRDRENEAAVRVCWANTGNEGASNFAEVICAVDRDPLSADPAQITVVVNRVVEGDPEFNSFDNLAFQPRTGNLYVIEDHGNGDVFACLPDGEDRDIKTDGCVRILSVRDSSAEPTGFLFSSDGRTAYVSIQHSRDDLMPTVDHYPTDDVLRITGFGVLRR